MTTPNGTENAEQSLNVPENEDRFLEQLQAAVASGNQDEVDRLMALEIQEDEPQVNEPEGEPPAEEDAPPEETPETPTEQAEETPAPEAGEVPAQQQVAAEDKLAALEAELHAIKSQAGRMNHLQSQVAQLKKLVDQYQKQAAEQAAANRQPSKLDKQLEKLKDIDPEMAETIEALREEFVPPAAQPGPQADPDDELARVERVHPDVHDILPGGRLRPYWEQWKSMLRPEHLAMAESDRAEDFIVAVNAFKYDLATLTQQQVQQQPNTQTTQPPTQEQPSPAAAATRAARERKLNAAAPTRTPPIKPSGGPVDAEQLFSEMYKKAAENGGIR